MKDARNMVDAQAVSIYQIHGPSIAQKGLRTKSPDHVRYRIATEDFGEERAVLALVSGRAPMGVPNVPARVDRD